MAILILLPAEDPSELGDRPRMLVDPKVDPPVASCSGKLVAAIISGRTAR